MSGDNERKSILMRSQKNTRLAFSPRYGFFQEVETGDDMASVGQEQGVLASAATRIEDRANDFVGCSFECWLRLPDVPRRLSRVGANKMFTIPAGALKVGHNESRDNYIPEKSEGAPSENTIGPGLSGTSRTV
jgi:hypothetical protein